MADPNRLAARDALQAQKNVGRDVQEEERFKTGQASYQDSENDSITSFLSNVAPVGILGTAAIAGAPLAAEMVGSVADDVLVHSDQAIAQKNKMNALGGKSATSRRLKSAEKALAGVTPVTADKVADAAVQDPYNKGLAPFEKKLKKGQVTQDIFGNIRRATARTAAGETGAWGSPMNKPVINAWVKVTEQAERSIQSMPPLHPALQKQLTNAATKGKAAAGVAYQLSDEALQGAMSTYKTLENTHILKGLKIFGKKAMFTGAVASSPHVAAALAAAALPLAYVHELAKHGKIDEMLKTTAYRLKQGPVKHSDVGNTVHAYLISNPDKATELYSQGAIARDYHEWVQEASAAVLGRQGPVEDDQRESEEAAQAFEEDRRQNQ